MQDIFFQGPVKKKKLILNELLWISKGAWDN
jgi:hypothetical protein